MKTLTAGIVFTLLAALTALIALPAAQAQEPDAPHAPKPQKEHEWLKQLVGEWDVEAELVIGPDQPPIKTKGTETVRAIGEFWILAETKGEAFGQPFTGLMTLGYDPAKKRYVGTWVDSTNSHLWTYRGSLNKDANTLTLEAEGPIPGAEKPAKFKETIAFKNKDHRTFTSTIQSEEGEWITIMTAQYRRKK